jgi:hypothetical protein
MSKMFAFEFIRYNDSLTAENDIDGDTYTFDFIGSDEEIDVLYEKLMNGPEYDTFSALTENEFGLHDFFGTEKVLIGFTSDEIKPDRYDRLMEVWKEYFVKNGFQVGDTVIHKGESVLSLID